MAKSSKSKKNAESRELLEALKKKKISARIHYWKQLRTHC